MFTVKVCRIHGGESITKLYEARSVEIVDNLSQKAVIADMPAGETAFLPVMMKGAEDPGELYDVIFVENANGKTTEILRA